MKSPHPIGSGMLLVLVLTGYGFSVPYAARSALPLAQSALAAPDPGMPVPATLQLSTSWATQVSAGNAHTCALTVGGGVKCWGSNTYGELGDDTTRQRAAPVAVAGLNEQIALLSVGSTYACAVTESAGAKCWGWNRDGQLGDGTTVDRWRAVDVLGMTSGVRAISTGDSHTCALMASGGIKCWGNNDHGQLGDGTTTPRLMPVDVAGLTSGVRALSAGDAQTCAVTESDELQCWGDNGHGQLGDGTQVDRLTATAVVGLSSGVRTVSAGGVHTCAVTTSGGVKCWGGNYGLVGDGTTERRLTPVDVVGLSSGVQGISAGRHHTCAQTISGAAKCWGENDYGQLGDGHTAYSSLIPVDVTGLSTGVRDVAVGGLHTCAVTASGDAKCWGSNWAGQLGDGTTMNRLTPVDVWNLAHDCAAVTEISMPECEALVTLFRATNGPLWQDRTGWLQSTTPCDWYGVTCAAGHVSQLNLPANNLVDALPAAMGDLVALERLDLHGNELGGPLPLTLGNLGGLQHLDLSANNLTGLLPLTLGNLSGLETLLLDENALTGPLLATLGNLRELRVLDLHHNTFTGALPVQLGNLTALEYLDASANVLSGPLPEALGALTALQHLDLSHNQFLDNPEGYYGAAIDRMTVLRYLDLSYNRLGGGLPWWPDLGALEHLDLSHNDFVGSLPWQTDKLTNLRYVALHTNHLSGAIPPSWGHIGAGVAITPTGAPPPPGVYIDLSGNHLYGAVPIELAQNPAIMGLQLAGNQLSGLVPAAFRDRPFYLLDLNYNQLTFTDPWWSQWVFPTQTVPPTALQATVIDGTVILTWTPILYTTDLPEFTGEAGFYEISYASAPTGPYAVHGITGSKRANHYTVSGLPPGAPYYFRVRTFSTAHNRYAYSEGWAIFDHTYIQPNNLWSDYTPVVCVNCEPAPASALTFLPLAVR